MVKLAKKRTKGFEKSTIDPHGLSLARSGVINIPTTYKLQGEHLGKEAYLLVVALYALSNTRCEVVLHEEEMRLAASLADIMTDEKGDLNIDQFKEAFGFYDGVLKTLFNVKKIERRKNKKFGEPKFPSLEDMWATFENLEQAGLIDKSGKVLGTKYDMALMKQQLERDGYDVSSIVHKSDG